MPDDAVARARKWWPIAALLLIGSIISALFGVEKAYDRAVALIWPAPATAFAGQICTRYDGEECAGNAAFLEFLQSRVGKVVTLDVTLISIGHGAWWDACEEAFRSYDDVVTARFPKAYALPVSLDDCEPDYVGGVHDHLVQIRGGSGVGEFRLAGSFVVVQEKIGPIGMLTLRPDGA